MVKSERENPLKRGGRPGLDQDTLAALGSVANLLLELKQYDQAAPLLQECIDGLAMLVGPTHQSTLAATSNLAICFVKTTDFAAALPLAKQSLKGFTQVQGKQHPNTVKAAALMDEVTARLDSCASEQPEPAPEPAPPTETPPPIPPTSVSATVANHIDKSGATDGKEGEEKNSNFLVFLIISVVVMLALVGAYVKLCRRKSIKPADIDLDSEGFGAITRDSHFNRTTKTTTNELVTNMAP